MGFWKGLASFAEGRSEGISFRSCFEKGRGTLVLVGENAGPGSGLPGPAKVLFGVSVREPNRGYQPATVVGACWCEVASEQVRAAVPMVGMVAARV